MSTTHFINEIYYFLPFCNILEWILLVETHETIIMVRRWLNWRKYFLFHIVIFWPGVFVRPIVLIDIIFVIQWIIALVPEWICVWARSIKVIEIFSKIFVFINVFQGLIWRLWGILILYEVKNCVRMVMINDNVILNRFLELCEMSTEG